MAGITAAALLGLAWSAGCSAGQIASAFDADGELIGLPFRTDAPMLPATEPRQPELPPPAGSASSPAALERPAAGRSNDGTVRSLSDLGDGSHAAGARRRLTHDEISALVERGNEFVRAADIAAARLLFQRAAEAGDPQAALALGATYDPATLQELGLGNFSSDVAMARSWYERARELGSPRAVARLKLLSGRADLPAAPRD